LSTPFRVSSEASSVVEAAQVAGVDLADRLLARPLQADQLAQAAGLGQEATALGRAALDQQLADDVVPVRRAGECRTFRWSQVPGPEPLVPARVLGRVEAIGRDPDQALAIGADIGLGVRGAGDQQDVAAAARADA
jgi:hypothetical protein